MLARALGKARTSSSSCASSSSLPFSFNLSPQIDAALNRFSAHARSKHNSSVFDRSTQNFLNPRYSIDRSTQNRLNSVLNQCSVHQIHGVVGRNSGFGLGLATFLRRFSGSRALQEKKGAGSASAVKHGGFIGWYLRNLDKRPVVTKSLTACTIYTTADVVSQKLTAMKTGDDTPWDHIRTLRMALVGLLMSGPTLHLWFNFLNRILPGRDMVSILKKLVLGQCTYGPAFTACFFSINALAQGEDGAEIWQRLKRDLIPTLASGLMYWPFCDMITFRFIPVHLQPLVSNSFSLVWTVYLTYMASLKK